MDLIKLKQMMDAGYTPATVVVKDLIALVERQEAELAAARAPAVAEQVDALTDEQIATMYMAAQDQGASGVSPALHLARAVERHVIAATRPAAPVQAASERPIAADVGGLSVDELHNFIVQNRDSAMSMFEFRTQIKAKLSAVLAAPPAQGLMDAKDAARKPMTNTEIHEVAHKYTRFMGGDTYSDTEFACLQDVIAFAKEIERMTGNAGEGNKS